jgi:predicted enzyme related to lactoylglutathione lyase
MHGCVALCKHPCRTATQGRVCYSLFIMLHGVERILIRVPNAQAAARFYVATFGMKIDRTHSGAVALKFADAPTEIILHEDKQRPETDIAYSVEDVRQLYARRETTGLVFVQPPTPSGAGYRATLRDPFGTLLTIIDRGHTQETPAQNSAYLFKNDESTQVSEPLIKPRHDRVKLMDIYVRIARTADDLPYTPHFEQLYSLYVRALSADHQLTHNKPTHNDVWRELLNMRKAGKLPRLGPATSKPPVIDAQDKKRLRDLLGADIGKRDRLPYTPRFDALVSAFNTAFARAYSPHVVWRIVATLAK